MACLLTTVFIIKFTFPFIINPQYWADLPELSAQIPKEYYFL